MASTLADYQAPVMNRPVETQPFPVFRVPLPLRSIAEAMFSPKIVSVGPFHHPEFNLGCSPTTVNIMDSGFKQMERYKLLAVEMMSEDFSFRELVESLKKDEKKIFGFYEGLAESYNGALKRLDLLQIVALDACFIVSMLQSFFQDNFSYFELNPEASTFLKQYMLDARFHPIYSGKLSRPVRKAILQDLILVENQIPLFAVKEVIRMDHRCKEEGKAGKLLEYYVAAMAIRMLPFNNSKKKVFNSVKGLSVKGEHLLDCMYSIVCGRDADHSSSCALVYPYPEEMPGAKRLYNSGVTLESHDGSLNELSFDIDKGKLMIPSIHVGDDTEMIFRNLIAYESCYKLDRVDVLSYLHFMDYLIDTPEDVELLAEDKIITEHIGSNEVVAQMWNGLCRNTVPVFSSKYKDECAKANKYCSSSWKRLWVEFYRSNLSRPWLVASLISAAALLCMNFVIMWYTILLYSNETKSKAAR